MTDFKGIVYRCMALSGAVLLAACGGGSSGGGTPVAPNPSLDPDNLADQPVVVSPESDIRGILGLYSDIQYGFDLTREIRAKLSGPGDGTSGTIPCGQGGTAAVTYAGSGDNDDETWVFDDCVVATDTAGTVMFNGDYRYVATLTGSDLPKGYESFNITGALVGSGEQLRIRGRADWEFVDTSTGTSVSGRIIETINTFELVVGSRYVAITGRETRIEQDEERTQFETKGTFIGSAIGGYFQLATPEPLVLVHGEECPQSGNIRLSSDGVAEILFGSSTLGTALAVAIWIDGEVVESYDDCTGVSFVPIY